MAKGSKKELTTEEIKKQAIHKMLESLIAGNASEAGTHIHDYLQIKLQEIILGEKHKEDDDDDDDDKKCNHDDCKHGKCKHEDEDEDEDKDKDKKVDEQSMSTAFANSGSVMSDKVEKIKHENGGKKTLKKHGNAPKELDDDAVGKTKFKSGGKQPANTLEKTPKPNKFNDGRDKELGTTKA